MKVATLLAVTAFLSMALSVIAPVYTSMIDQETWAMVAAISYPLLLGSALAMPFCSWRI